MWPKSLISYLSFKFMDLVELAVFFGIIFVIVRITLGTFSFRNPGLQYVRIHDVVDLEFDIFSPVKRRVSHG